MANINQTVWKILRGDLAIQKDLSRQIINMRALAKYILKQYSLQVSLDAVISAIRRFQSQEIFEEEEVQLLSALKDSLITTKNNVSCLTIQTTEAAVTKLAKVISEHPDVRMVMGSREIKIFLENRDLEAVSLTLGCGPNTCKLNDGLAQISVVASELVGNIRGVAARITSEISLANININELLICQPEFLIYINEKDTVQAHNSLLQLCSGNKL